MYWFNLLLIISSLILNEVEKTKKMWGKKKKINKKKTKHKKKKTKKNNKTTKKKTHEKQYFSQRVLEYLLIHTIVTLFFWLYIKSF